MDKLQSLLGIMQNIAGLAALALGAIWAYYKFIKGRVFEPRLQPEISARVEYIDEICYLLISLQLRNVGSSKVPILSSSGLDVLTDRTEDLPKAEAEREKLETVQWDGPITFDVFEYHKWVESGQAIQEEKMIALSRGNKIAIKLELHIDSQEKRTTAVKIILLSPPNGSKDGPI